MALKHGQLYRPARTYDETVGVDWPVEYAGGYLYNQFEGGWKNSVDADETAFGGANLYGNGTDTWYSVLAGNVNSHINGTEGVWLQWEKVNGVCHVKAAIAYPVGTVLTEAQYNQVVRWAGDPTCGDGAVPFGG